ncbi:lumazine-binding protein [Capnocytophaga cynodegmi]|uniref:lumazine-binding protein n=1 Tax=Capnocytophaga cynodegmi TaxID=28189 RepID=UPI00385EF7BC
MRKLFLNLVMFSMFLFVSCSGDSPRKVAEKFLEAMENQNFEEAKKYSDDSMKQLLNMLDSMPKDNNKKAENAKVKVTKIEENGDKAKVFYIVESSEIQEESKEQSIDLKKVDGNWKVSFNKEEMNKEEPAGNLDATESENQSSEEQITTELEDLEAEVVTETTE